jgi:hypothetical protein
MKNGVGSEYAGVSSIKSLPPRRPIMMRVALNLLGRAPSVHGVHVAVDKNNHFTARSLLARSKLPAWALRGGALTSARPPRRTLLLIQADFF